MPAEPQDPATSPPHLPPLPEGRSRREMAQELLLAFGATVVAIVVITWVGRAWSIVLENAQVLAALVFIYLPIWLLRREGTAPEALGIHTDGLRRQIVVALATCAVVFPLFTLGFHVLQTEVVDRSASWDDHVWLRWPTELQDRPQALPPVRPVAVWAERETLTVLWNAPPKGSQWDVRVELDAPPDRIERTTVRQGQLLVRQPRSVGRDRIAEPEPGVLETRSRSADGLRVRADDAYTALVAVSLDGVPIPSKEIAVGRFAIEAPEDAPLHLDRSWTWLAWLLLVHLVAVAIPEELFYRGYVQSRLDQLMAPRWHLLGARIGPGLVATSALFALGHFLIELDPGRLVVFFPSLLFGWLRNRTDSIAAASIVHGLANVLLAIVSRAYV